MTVRDKERLFLGLAGLWTVAGIVLNGDPVGAAATACFAVVLGFTLALGKWR